MKKIALVILSVALCAGAQAQNVASGYVFEDKNQNGKKDRRESGLSEIAVSNGREVVLTDKNGFYQLPVGQDNIIFVIKPTGYQTPVKETNLPDFHYIHKPLGSPTNFKYKAVEPTGPLPKEINFPLYAQEEKEQFSALVFGDPQPYSLQEIEYFKKAIISETSNIQNVAFGISLGDLVGDNLDLHTPYINAVKEIGIPWFNVIGNHDLNFEATADSLSDETFELNFGPANYSFNYGKAHFMVLDDVLYPDPRDQKGYWGGFREDQLDFIRNNLKFVPKDRLIVISLHIPLWNEFGDAFRLDDRKELFSMLQDYENVLVMSAHTHLQKNVTYGKEEGWFGKKPLHEYNAGTTSGDWYKGEINKLGVPQSTMRDGTPRGYAFLRINGNQYSIDYKVAGEPEDYQIEVFNPKVVAHKERTSAGIYANFFMGKEGDTVEYRINDGEWKAMSMVNSFDPAYLNLLNRWDIAEELMPGRRPSHPRESSHLWHAAIPTNLPIGNHQIEIRAKDMFGKVHFANSTYRIETPKKY